ncbi:MAG TPA: hypothetical protein VGG20_20870 [Thermoanaerobaculia bacterium]|jgi:hypothetical protein
MYFEAWKSVEDSGLWTLFQAYFSLYQTVRSAHSEREILAIHCDPLEEARAPHALYKQGPHLHVKLAEDPIPHAHFALNRGHLPDVLSSVGSISSAMEMALIMVREQVLDLDWSRVA